MSAGGQQEADDGPRKKAHWFLDAKPWPPLEVANVQDRLRFINETVRSWDLKPDQLDLYLTVMGHKQPFARARGFYDTRVPDHVTAFGFPADLEDWSSRQMYM